MRHGRILAVVVGLSSACASFSSSSDPEPIDGADASTEDGGGGDAEPSADGRAKDSAPVDARDAGSVGCDGAAACERVVFMTSLQFRPEELNGIAGATQRCNEAAAAANAHKRVRGRTFLPWLSDGVVSPASTMVHGTLPYVLPTGTIVANDWSDLTDGTIAGTITRDELGASAPASRVVWTGTNQAGATTTSHCAQWTTSDAAAFATTGSADETKLGQWTARTTLEDCDTDHRIYCFEK